MRQAAVAGRMSGRYGARYGARSQRANGVSRESGFVDLATATYAMDTTGSIVLIPTVAQGASVNQRVGKKVMWKSIQCRGSYFNGTTGVANDVAFLIVYDKRPTGVLPLITDILVAANSQAFNNDANSGRFRILKRVDDVLIGNTTTPTTGQEDKDCSFFLDLKGLPCVFKAAATGAINDIEEGAIYLVTVGDNAPGTAAAATNLSFRTRFLDV